MTALFRLVLIVVSVGTCALINHKIRRSRISIEESVFWLLLSMMFVVFALFPVLPDTLAGLLGIYSTPNFLFLFIIFILLVKNFNMSMKLGALEERLKTLVQELALTEKEDAAANEDERSSAGGAVGRDITARGRSNAETAVPTEQQAVPDTEKRQPK